MRALRAYWAWSRSPDGRVALPASGAVKLVDQDIEAHRKVLDALLATERSLDVLALRNRLLEAGDKFVAAEAELNETSFVQICQNGVVVRVGPEFCNHLYATPALLPGNAVVAFNTRYGSITISFADQPKEGAGAREIVQSLWGPEAGGHAGIAGSPRGKRMSLADLDRAAKAAVDALATHD